MTDLGMVKAVRDQTEAFKAINQSLKQINFTLIELGKVLVQLVAELKDEEVTIPESQKAAVPLLDPVQIANLKKEMNDDA